uniref:Uncharacterized protein n=1 Tax=Coccidioides posadasii RMSCC 3488 TaxID=454284 RepID=A0A0J6FFZ3_COCPO|nr:hypothetical protein CPAG_05514 [Coccidioides posadasii RMSCC 3488]
MAKCGPKVFLAAVFPSRTAVRSQDIPLISRAVHGFFRRRASQIPPPLFTSKAVHDPRAYMHAPEASSIRFKFQHTPIPVLWLYVHLLGFTSLWKGLRWPT